MLARKQDFAKGGGLNQKFKCLPKRSNLVEMMIQTS